MSHVDIENPELLHRNRLSACCHHWPFANEDEAIRSLDPVRDVVSSRVLSLAGDWRFSYWPCPQKSPENFFEPDYDDRDWDHLAVPSCWQLQGYGRPQYLNILYPFPVDPPRVPSENPTGCYRRAFSLTDDVAGMKQILRFEGVDSAFHVWVNGHAVGYSQGSRMTSEFDITPYICAGENILAVRVYQWSDGSYLEDQDMWWLSGIFRNVSILSRPVHHLVDAKINADMHGALIVETECSAPSSIELKLFDGDNLIVKEMSADRFDLKIESPKLWTAETPNLYTLLLSVRDESEQITEIVPFRIGFRTISITDDGVFRINDQPIKFHGVNRHEHHSDTGRTLDLTTMLRDIELLKSHNINAVRTSHYPSDARWYVLCDHFGLYVMDEADLETHGFNLIGNWNQLADDSVWKAAFIDRATRLVQRDRNHASVVMWSLGNEAGFSDNHRAMASVVRELDPTRPLHYEGDVSAEAVDVVSQMYTTPDDLRGYAKGDLSQVRYDIAITPEHYLHKPFVLCEYAHVLGNGPGELADYETIFDSDPRMAGGFIWEWIDHGLRTKTSDAIEYFGYGGDFGDQPNDGLFLIDGLVSPDRVPSPGLMEFKAVVQPVRMSAGDHMGVVKLENRYSFRDLSHLELVWSMTHGEKVIDTGAMDLPVIEPGETGELALPLKPLPAGSNAVCLNLDLQLKHDELPMRRGHVVASGQCVLREYKKNLENRTSKKSVRHTTERSLIFLQAGETEIVFDQCLGRLDRMSHRGKVLMSPGPRLNLWRAPIGNENATPACLDHKLWQRAQLRHLQHRIDDVQINEEEGVLLIAVDARIAPPWWTYGVNVRYTYRIDGNGRVALRVAGDFESGWPEVLPRIGLSFSVPLELDQVTWHGLGPGEAYCDSRAAQRIGVYQSTVCEMETPYIVPQEYGNRHRVDWFELSSNEGKTLRFEHDQPLDFSAHRYMLDNLTQAMHRYELKPAESLQVYIDWKQNGLGSESCCVPLSPKYHCKPESFDFRLNWYGL